MTAYSSKFWRGEIEHDGPMWDDLSPREQDQWLKDHDMVHCDKCGEPAYQRDGLDDLCDKCEPK
jgi:hypothetical protein